MPCRTDEDGLTALKITRITPPLGASVELLCSGTNVLNVCVVTYKWIPVLDPVAKKTESSTEACPTALQGALPGLLPDAVPPVTPRLDRTVEIRRAF